MKHNVKILLYCTVTLLTESLLYPHTPATIVTLQASAHRSAGYTSDRIPLLLGGMVTALGAASRMVSLSTLLLGGSAVAGWRFNRRLINIEKKAEALVLKLNNFHDEFKHVSTRQSADLTTLIASGKKIEHEIVDMHNKLNLVYSQGYAIKIIIERLGSSTPAPATYKNSFIAQCAKKLYPFKNYSAA